MERALLPSLNVVDLSLGEGALEELLLEELLLVECHEAQSHWRRLELSVLQVEDELACAEVSMGLHQGCSSPTPWLPGALTPWPPPGPGTGG